MNGSTKYEAINPEAFIQLYQLTGSETTLPPEIRHRLYVRLNLEDYVKRD